MTPATDALAARIGGPLAAVEPFIRRWIRPALWLLVLLPLAWLVYRGVTGALGADPVEKVEHETGLWALRLLAGSLAVSPLIRITGWGWLIPQRRFLGLATFFWALAHLLVYFGLDRQLDLAEIAEDIVKRTYITMGMLAFVLLIPLALTSTKASIRRLGGKRWNRLHKLVYVSAVAACIHFFWGVKKDVTEPILYSAVFVLLFALRFVMRRSRQVPVRP